jgi:hypothetical protein
MERNGASRRRFDSLFDWLAMFEYVLERVLYGAMAAVLIVPELATFLVFLAFSLGLAAFCGRFGWNLAASLLREDRPPAEASAIAG